MESNPEAPERPEPGEPAVHSQHLRVSLVWLVPLVAALVGLSLVLKGWLAAGPEIRISFQTAAGLEAGKTAVKYKDVAIGTVTEISLSPDHSHVVVRVALQKSAEDFARAGSRFWVVRPRVGVGGVSGIDTVLSGAYIGVDIGEAVESKRSFTGLETPPTMVSGTPGKSFVLHGENLGSLDIGSPVYYRHIQVGEVAAYRLAEDGQRVRIQVFVRTPYDRFVTAMSRFWNASGLDLSLGADGLKLNTQSLATVVAGGIAFANPPGKEMAPAADQAEFQLAADATTALAPPDGPPLAIRMRFEQSLRGLAANAPVEFLGMNVGRVVSVDLDYDRATQRFPVIVEARVYPQRLGRALAKLSLAEDDPLRIAKFIGHMVGNGLRAQARTGNLLTGQLYIALDFVPRAPKAAFDPAAKPLEIPTAGGNFDKLQEQLFGIVAKLEKIPFDSIGQHLDDSLGELDKTLKQVNGEVLPEARRTLRGAQGTLDSAGKAFASADAALAADAPLQQGLGLTLQEVQRAARSLRVLTDLLGRNPEALLRGRPANPEPLPPSSPKESRP